jgi:hypothetical protein
MNLEALEQLKRVARTIPTDELNMGSWDCGTQACLAGHACRQEWFKESGLFYNGLEPEWGTSTGFTALKRFFDIKYYQAQWLFSPVAYRSSQPSNATLVAHINDVIAERVL